MVREESLNKDDALRLQIETLWARVAKMSEVSRRVTEIWDIDAVLQEIVDGARLLTDARYGAVGVFDSSGRVREFITSGITPEERSLLGDPPQGLGLLGYLNEIQEPLRLADLSQHSRSVGFPENHPPMKSFLGAPIRHHNEPVGNIFLTEKEGGKEFSEEDEDILVMFASQAAVSIVNALKYKEEQQTRDQVEQLLLPDLILAEVAYVLKSYYEVARLQVAEALRSILAFRAIRVVDGALLQRTVELYEVHDLDFADAYLVASAERTDVGVVASFDRGIDRVGTVLREESS